MDHQPQVVDGELFAIGRTFGTGLVRDEELRDGVEREQWMVPGAGTVVHALPAGGLEAADGLDGRLVAWRRHDHQVRATRPGHEGLAGLPVPFEEPQGERQW